VEGRAAGRSGTVEINDAPNEYQAAEAWFWWKRGKADGES